jgi:hypothetical protein
LRSSTTLASRLVAAKAELVRLKAAAQAPKVRRVAPNVEERCLSILRRLQQTLDSDPERARAALVPSVLGEHNSWRRRCIELPRLSRGIAGIRCVSIKTRGGYFQEAAPSVAFKPRTTVLTDSSIP